jgi:hypothetical protein
VCTAINQCRVSLAGSQFMKAYYVSWLTLAWRSDVDCPCKNTLCQRSYHRLTVVICIASEQHGCQVRLCFGTARHDHRACPLLSIHADIQPCTEGGVYYDY